MRVHVVMDVICVHSSLGFARFTCAALQGKAELMAERPFRAHFTDGLHVGDPATFTGSQSETTSPAALRQAATTKGETS